jgi:hypothetical protein
MVTIPNKILRMGDKDQQVIKLHDYLKEFGYMKSNRTEILDYRIDLERAANEPEQDDDECIAGSYLTTYLLL